MAGLWIEYHLTLREFWKVQRLADLLQIPYAHALGLVSCLWVWAAANQGDGNLARFSDQEIARAARWEGSVNGFRGYLVQSELLDKDGKVHRWDRYGTRVLGESRRKQQEYRDRLKAKRRGKK